MPSSIGDRVLGRDLADLKVGAGRHMGIAAAVGVGEVGEAGELPMVEDAVRDAQPAHEASSASGAT